MDQQNGTQAMDSAIEKLMTPGEPHPITFDRNEAIELKKLVGFILTIKGAGPLARLLYRTIKAVSPFVVAGYLIWKYGVIQGLAEWVRSWG